MNEHRPDIRTATLWTHLDNLASQRTAERAGFLRDPDADAERELDGRSAATTAYRLQLQLQ